MRYRRPEPFYDPYFYWARKENRRPELYQFKNLHVEDVSCAYCSYRPKPRTQHPKQCYRAHMKKQHPREFIHDLQPITFLIIEDPDLALV